MLQMGDSPLWIRKKHGHIGSWLKFEDVFSFEYKKSTPKSESCEPKKITVKHWQEIVQNNSYRQGGRLPVIKGVITLPYPTYRRIIPFSKWLITMISLPPLSRVSLVINGWVYTLN